MPLNRPPYTPDLSPIEYLWEQLDVRVQKRWNILTIPTQLRRALLEEWSIIPLEEDQCINEIHADENKGSNNSERWQATY